jgi:hypothetical protein
MIQVPVMRDHRATGTFREIKEGDKINFLCNGKGRGGHLRVTVRVKKINRKTMKAIELDRSYSPGTAWTLHFDYLEDSNTTIVEYSPEWIAQYGDPTFEVGDKVVIDRKFIFEAGKKGTVLCLLESGQYKIQLSGRTANVGPGLLQKVEA